MKYIIGIMAGSSVIYGDHVTDAIGRKHTEGVLAGHSLTNASRESCGRMK